MDTFASRSRIGKLSRGFGSTTLARGRRKSWWIPIGITIVLLGVGVWTRVSMENAMRRDLRDGLESILSANVEAVLGWLDNAVKTAEVMATREAVQSISAGLAKTDAEDLAASPLQAEMAAALRDAVETNGYLGHAILDGSGRFLASPRPESIGTRSPVIQPYLAT